MTPAQTMLVMRRSEVIRRWPPIGIVVAMLVVGLYAFAFHRLPIEAKPAVLAAQVQAGQISLEGMGHLVIIGSVAFLACGIFILTVLGVVTLSLVNEKRLIEIVRAQEVELNALRPPAAVDSGAAPAAPEPTSGDGL